MSLTVILCRDKDLLTAFKRGAMLVKSLQTTIDFGSKNGADHCLVIDDPLCVASKTYRLSKQGGLKEVEPTTA